MSHKTDWNTDNLTEEQIQQMEAELEKVAEQQRLYEQLAALRQSSSD